MTTATAATAAKPDIHCLKCKKRTASTAVAQVTMKNGRPAVNALCADCGGKKFRIGKL